MKFIILLVLILLLGFLYLYRMKEGFDPYKPETRPMHYPDQTYDSNIVNAQKHIQTLIRGGKLSREQKIHLNDLLILLQFI